MSTAGADICLSCGLCCDGSLFWAVPISGDETAPFPTDNAGRLPQPCACYAGRCTIYQARPSACRAFNCQVLEQVLHGDQHTDWALGRINEMRDVIAQLDAVLEGPQPSVYGRVAAFLEENRTKLEDATFISEHREVLKRIAGYEEILRVFRDLDA